MTSDPPAEAMTRQLRLVRHDDRWQECGPLLGSPVMYPVDSATPITRVAADDLSAHITRFGPRPSALGSAAGEVIDTLDAIARNVGAWHLPSSAEWRAHVAVGRSGVVVVNGAASEPASANEIALMQLRPHLVLDGIACAAEAVGAHDAVLWLRGGTNSARAAMVRALEQRRAARLPEPHIRLVVGPDRYVSGEASAIVSALSGGPTLPQFRTQPIAVSGVHGLPTLVHDIETFARTALAARSGPDEYVATTLLTVADDTARTVVEVAPHTPLGEVIETVAGCFDEQKPQAVLVGGFRGRWLRWDAMSTLPANADHLRARGIDLGGGVLMPLAHDGCGLAVVARIARYLAANSARQCGPCVLGQQALSEAISEIADVRATHGGIRRAKRYLNEITGRGACALPDDGARMIQSALATFADDLHAHRRRGGCAHRGTPRTFPVPDSL